MPGLPDNPSESFKRRNPHLYENHSAGSLPNAVAECDQAAALVPAVPGKTKSVRRITVRFVGYRVKPLDPDNFAGSVKDLLDGLRHSGLIPGDEPWRIILETEQVRVRSLGEEKTIIEIDGLGD